MNWGPDWRGEARESDRSADPPPPPTKELCLTCGKAAEKEGEGRPQSQG